MKAKRFFGYTWFILILVAMATGCAPRETIPDGPIIYEGNGAVRQEIIDGLDVKVLDFSWRYLTNTDQIHLKGTAQNLGDQTVQGVRIIAAAYDQFGYALGQGETYLNPTTLGPDRTAHFDFYLPRGSWVQAIHLDYRFESRY